MHVFGFVISIYHHARSPERQMLTIVLQKTVCRGHRAVPDEGNVHNAVNWPSSQVKARHYGNEDSQVVIMTCG